MMRSVACCDMPLSVSDFPKCAKRLAALVPSELESLHLLWEAEDLVSVVTLEDDLYTLTGWLGTNTALSIVV